VNGQSLNELLTSSYCLLGELREENILLVY